MKRKGNKVKNHMSDNLRQLRQKELVNREKRYEENQPSKELYKLEQFRDVQARVYDNINNENNENQQSDYLVKGQSERARNEIRIKSRAIRNELESKMEEAKYYAGTKERPVDPVSPRKPELPHDTAKLAPRNDANFIARNKVKALTSSPPSKQPRDEQPIHKSYGKVPNYLENRKQQWEEQKEEARRRAPDPDAPKGMKLMPESERIGTLQVLWQSKEEAVRQLGKMPFCIETPSLRNKQNMLEQKLREIENAIALFSRPKVYIANDE
jgi:hypothetical protein